MAARDQKASRTLIRVCTCTLFATVAATGMRPEEVYALEMDRRAVLDDNQVFVRRSLSWSRAGPKKRAVLLT